VADKAKGQRVQRSAGDEGYMAEDIRRAPQTSDEAGPYIICSTNRNLSPEISS